MKRTTKKVFHKYVKRYFILDLECSSFSYKRNRQSYKSQFGISLSLINGFELSAEKLHTPPKGYSAGFMVNTEYHRFVLFTTPENYVMWINGFASILSLVNRPCMYYPPQEKQLQGEDRLFCDNRGMSSELKCRTERSYSKDAILSRNQLPDTNSSIYEQTAGESYKIQQPKEITSEQDQEQIPSTQVISSKVEQSIKTDTLNITNQVIQQIQLQAEAIQKKKHETLQANKGGAQTEKKIIPKLLQDPQNIQNKQIMLVPQRTQDSCMQKIKEKQEPAKLEQPKVIKAVQLLTADMNIASQEHIASKEQSVKTYKIVKLQKPSAKAHLATNYNTENTVSRAQKSQHSLYNPIAYQPEIKKIEKKQESTLILTQRFPSAQRNNHCKPILTSRVDAIDKSDIKELGLELFSPDDPNLEQMMPSQRNRSKSQNSTVRKSKY